MASARLTSRSTDRSPTPARTSVAPPADPAPGAYGYADLVAALGDRVAPPLLALSLLVRLLAELDAEAAVAGAASSCDAGRVRLATDPRVLLADATRDPRLCLVPAPSPRWRPWPWRRPADVADAAGLVARLLVPPALRDDPAALHAAMPPRLAPLFTRLLARDRRRRLARPAALAAARALAAEELGIWLERRHREPPPAAGPWLPPATSRGILRARRRARTTRRPLLLWTAGPVALATLLTSLVATILFLSGP